MNALKNFLMRIVLRRKRVRISHNVDISNVVFEEYCNVAHHAQISNSRVGKRTSIGRYTKIQNTDIGSYCSISWDITIGAVSHPISAVSTHAFTYRKQFGICDSDYHINHKRVVIGNDVWIGCNVVVMPGIKIGTGAVIGAGSIVTKDVKPYEIVAGNPATHIKYRFKQEIIERLLNTEWWNLSDKVIKDNIHLFQCDNDLNIDAEIVERLCRLKILKEV